MRIDGTYPSYLANLGVQGNCQFCEESSVVYWESGDERRNFLEVCLNCAERMFPAMYAEAITLTRYGGVDYVERDLEKFACEFWQTLARRFARERALLYEKYE